MLFKAAFEYFLANIKENVDVKAFNEFCGVGVVVTPEQIKATVAEVINKNKDELVKSRYKFPLGNLMSELRNKIKWADGKLVKTELDNQVIKRRFFVWLIFI